MTRKVGRPKGTYPGMEEHIERYHDVLDAHSVRQARAWVAGEVHKLLQLLPRAKGDEDITAELTAEKEKFLQLGRLLDARQRVLRSHHASHP